MKETEGRLWIGADIRLDGSDKLRELLGGFSELAQRRDDVMLALAGRRCLDSEFSVWNFIDEKGLVDRVAFRPYYDLCRDFPVKKRDCAAWISSQSAPHDLTVDSLEELIASEAERRSKVALFITSFHPGKFEGNSTLMRQYLEHLRGAGYRVHVLYYRYDKDDVDPALRAQAMRDFDVYLEVDVATKIVGQNRNGLNVHVDDWCGEEVLTAVAELCGKYLYDVAIVNYAFMSAALEVVPAYVQKMLLTHDSFADRNRLMLSQGYSSAGWVSLDVEGERLACSRADIVIALQEKEATHFRNLGAAQTRIISPIMPYRPVMVTPQPPGAKLRIGYCGSSNWVNEENLGRYLAVWVELPEAVARSEIIIAGGIDPELFARIVPDGARILERARPRFMGRLDRLDAFFETCDIVINPERGGTGVKIKTLEALAAGAALITTAAGAVGLDSDSRFHAAQDASALARLTSEIVRDPAMIGTVQSEGARIYAAYFQRNAGALNELLGPPLRPAGPEWLPCVSIIVPFYKVEAYLPACLDSVIKQRHANLDIVLVDDAGGDGSRSIAERYAERDSRIRILSHPQNKGLGPARNTGAASARGEYIFFLDSDDVLSGPTVIGSLLDRARDTGADVVVGSCAKLYPDGRLESSDVLEARGRQNADGGSVSGRDAFAASMGLSDAYFLPLRAWGALIRRSFYDRSGLEYPPIEHEDIAHTPFLYYLANEVHYCKEIVVHYRVRADSLSNAQWPPQRFRHYGDLWVRVKTLIERYELGSFIGDAAVNLIGHMIWRIEQNHSNFIEYEAAVDIIAELMGDACSFTNEKLFFDAMAYVRDFLKDRMREPSFFARITREVPPRRVINFYRHRSGLTALAPAPERATAVTHADTSRSSRATQTFGEGQHLLSENEARCAAIFEEYDAEAEAWVKDFPAMLTRGDRALYFWAAKHWTHRGSIVDSGCFVGGTTSALIAGIKCNTSIRELPHRASQPIRVYDLFRIDDDYILEHLKQKYPDRDFCEGGSFLPVFLENMRGKEEYIEVRPGDVILSGYHDEEDIEILGVDVCKALPVTDFVTRELFPRLLPGALVIQQDFIHEFHPHIHLSMAKLEDHFEKFVEIEWGGSVAYKCQRRVSRETITERFGRDLAWYNEVEKNAALLRRVADNMLYDGNRWTLLLTLGIYFYHQGDIDQARSVYREACGAYPQFKAHQMTARMLGE